VSNIFEDVLLGGGLVGQLRQSRNAAKQQQKAAKMQQRIADIKARRARASQLQEAAILRARTEVSGEASGTASSSTTQGAVGSLQSQLAANVSFLDTVQQTSRNISGSLQKAADFQEKARLAGSISKAGMQLKGTGLF